jgi:uncharacterized membrane protein
VASSTTIARPRRRALAIFLNRLTYALCRHWFASFVLLGGTLVLLPWLAPVFMKLGLIGAAQTIYRLYSYACHQMPQRSFFLFGPQFMIPLDQIRATWRDTTNPMVLRQFIGSPELGYKVAWSDRMVSMYTSIVLGALLWWPFRRRIASLPVWGLVLAALPMSVDGLSHMASDLAGIGQGFRDTNLWLANLTGHQLPVSFYVGDAMGSFNSWMRLLTGAIFGLGLAWMIFPVLHELYEDGARQIERKFARAGVPL